MDILVIYLEATSPPTLQPSPRSLQPGLDLTIKASGTHQGLIQDVGTVGGSDHHHTLATFFFHRLAATWGKKFKMHMAISTWEGQKTQG